MNMLSKHRTSLLIIGIAAVATALVSLLGPHPTGLGQRPGQTLQSASDPGLEEIQKEPFAGFATLYQTIKLVQQHYLDAARIVPKEMLISALHELQLQVPMLIARVSDNKLTVIVGTAQKEFAVNDLKTPWNLLQRFKQIFDFIGKHIGQSDQEIRDLLYVAINGMLKSLDPHTVLLTPDYYRSMKDKTHGNFGGLGIVISIRDGELTIISPIDGTPAARAGLRAKDVITKIGDASTVNMPINDAVSLMRGKPGTKVAIYIKREGVAEELKYTITRAIVKVRSVDSANMAGHVGYIRIHDFQANTADDVQSHLSRLAKNAPLKGLVIDLRSNPGGLLTAAIDVADLFLKSGVIVTTAGQRRSERQVQQAENNGFEPEYPIVVLVNAGSASASEIVAGALKQNNRAVIVGERTFGKGSVQVLHEFPDNAALKLTTAQYLTPGDISIQSVGIVPHVALQKIQATPKRVDLRKPIAIRENDLHHHFENHQQQRQTIEKPDVTIRHLLPPQPHSDENDDNYLHDQVDDNMTEDEDITTQSTYNFKFKPDFEIQLAGQIISEMNRQHRTRFELAALKKLFDAINKKEQRKLIAAFSSMGVDWTPGPKTGNTDLTTLSITAALSPMPLRSGEKAILTVTVHNKGTSPVSQVLCTTHTDFAPLDQLELAFGRISKGATITRTLTVKVPAGSVDRIDDLLIRAENGQEQVIAQQAFRFVTNAIEIPVFSLGVALSDIEQGNGDGLLQKGETVSLVTNIKNIGKGPAQEVSATISTKTGSDVFLSVGRNRVGELAPGQMAQANFTFRFSKDPKTNAADLTFSVMDLRTRTVTAREVKIPTKAAINVVNRAGQFIPGNDHLPVYESPLGEATTIGFVSPPGELTVTGEANGRFRILINDDFAAWVDQKSVKQAPAQTDNEPSQATFTPLLANPPSIEVTPFAHVLKKSQVTIEGVANDPRGFKDLFIFRNDDKVFFASGKKGEGATGTIPFKTTITLEPGINYITIVAQETKSFQTRKTLVIRKDRSDDMPFISSFDVDGTPTPLGVVPITIPESAPAEPITQP